MSRHFMTRWMTNPTVMPPISNFPKKWTTCDGMHQKEALLNYCIALGDDSLMLGHRCLNGAAMDRFWRKTWH